MAVMLGLAVALSYGAGDFFGGLSSRRLPATTVVHASQLVGLVLLASTFLVVHDQRLVGADLVRGGLSGVVGLLGLVLLYRGLAAGAMSIVAPVTAVGAAVLPVAWGLARGERPAAPAYVGVVLALVAVLLVAGAGTDTVPVAGRAREVALALCAGAAFGVVFILLGSSSPDSGLWPVVAARLASVTVLTVVLLASGRPPGLPPPGTRVLVVAAGFFDVVANGLFVDASRNGLLSLVAVLSSLYPASTVVLARVVLHERVQRRQQLGLVLALAGVALIAA